MVGWRESNWWLRTLTGAIFGVAGVLLIYPYVDDAMLDVVEEEARKKARALEAYPASPAPPARSAPPESPTRPD
jgi:hypothetical protein